MLAANDISGRGATPRAAATTWAMVSASSAAASSQNHAPSAKRGSTSAATCAARRVLPTPPTPVSVTSRAVVRALPIAFSSASRPTNDVTCAGKFPGNASSELQARELAREPRRDHLEHALGAGEVAQRVLTEIDQLDGAVLHQLLGRARHHDLATVRHRHQPRGAVHRGAVVVAVTLFRGTAVDPHPHLQRLGQRPRFGTQRELGLDGRVDGVVRGGERGVEAVTGRLHHVPVV